MREPSLPDQNATEVPDTLPGSDPDAGRIARTPDETIGATWADGAGSAAEGIESTVNGVTLPESGRDATEVAEALDGHATARPIPLIPGYEILGELGRGGMGVVYRARQVQLDRPCALKMILAGAHADNVSILRFLAEARAVAKLHHPNIVQIHHIDQTGGLPFFELEYLEGGSLEKQLDGTPWPPRRAAGLVAALAGAMAEAHRVGLVHRDLKPANVLLTAEGAPKITDFGLAKSLARDSGLTSTESILGSPSYMAPEQAAGHTRDVGPAADVYSLGAIFYELATGRPPFVGASILETIEQVKSADPVSPCRLVPGLPRDLETICLKCLHKESSRRYSSAQALAEDLGRYLEGAPIVARPVPFWERWVKWAKRRPAIAALAVTIHLLLASLLGLGVWSYRRIGLALENERSERVTATIAGQQAVRSRNEALAETYRATLNEARALRLAVAPGWRDDALGKLAHLATVPFPDRDLVPLRSEAAACLAGLDVREVARFVGHQGPIWSLDFSPDGKTLASAGYEGTVWVWDVAGLRAARRHDDPASDRRQWYNDSAPRPAVGFRPGGGLAYASWSHRVEFLGEDGARSCWQPPTAAGQARSLSFSRDARRVAVGWAVGVDDGRVAVYDTVTGAMLRTVRTPSYFVPVALSPDGAWLAFVNRFEVHVVRVEGEGASIALGRTRPGDIRGLRFSPDGATLASVGDDQAVRLWDVAGREQPMALRGHESVISSVAFAPDGRWLATASDDHTMRLWDARTGLQILAIRPGGVQLAVAVSSDGTSVASSNDDGVIRLYRLVGQGERRRLEGHTYGVDSLAAHPRQPLLASGGSNTLLVVWDPIRGRMLWQANPFVQHPINAVAFSPDGTLLAVGPGVFGNVNDRDFSVQLWQASDGRRRVILRGPGAVVDQLAFDPQGRRIAAADRNGTVWSWDVPTGNPVPGNHSMNALKDHAKFNHSGDPIVFLGFHPDGSRLLVADRSGRVAVRDSESGRVVRQARLEGGIVGAVIVPGGDRLITSVGHSLRVLALPGLEPLSSLEEIPAAEPPDEYGYQPLAISPDGRLLAVVGRQRQVTLLDARSLRPWLALPPLMGWIKGVVFGAGGQTLAIAGTQSDITVWNLDLVRSELAGLGLDGPAPGPAAGGPPPVTVVRAGPDMPELREALGRLAAGLEQARDGATGEAIRTLEEVRDRLEHLVRAFPTEPHLLRPLATCLLSLGHLQERAGRPAEAPGSYQRLVSAAEAIPQPDGPLLYSVACARARLSVLHGADSPDPSSGQRAEAARAIDALRRAIAAAPKLAHSARSDTDFVPFRGLPEFQAVLQDIDFPADPFADPPR